jgi:hypothetical protein
MTPALERRLRAHRARVLIRSFDYRQRHHAGGVWFRLRRVLADASAVYAVSEQDAQRLLAEGRRIAPVGSELQPPKLILLAPASRVAELASAQPVPVRLGAPLLAASRLVIIPFQTDEALDPRP